MLKNFENADTELLIYATSLINKTLGGLSDQDSFYDESDCLEQQGMENIMQHYMSRNGTDLDLLDQFQLYETALRYEDGDADEYIHLSDNTLKKPLRYRSSKSTERRKSMRQSSVAPIPPPPPPPAGYQIMPPSVPPLPPSYINQQNAENDSSSSGGDLNGFSDCKVREGITGVTPGLRRRRERAERQKKFHKDQESEINGFMQTKSDENGRISFHSFEFYLSWLD